MMATAALVLAGVAIVGLLRYRYVRRARAWEALLRAQDGSAWLNDLDGAAADYALAGAMEARDERDDDEALRLLGLACDVLEDATSGRIRRLRKLARLTTMLCAVAPLDGLPRLAVRFRILVAAFSYAAWMLRRSRAAAERRPSERDAWARFTHALEQWRELDREGAAYARVLRDVLLAERPT